MRYLALALLCSCAHVQTEIPASLPLLYIDPVLEGPGISREAAEIFAAKRIQDRAKCATLSVDEQTKTKIALAQRDAAARAGISIGSAFGGAFITALFFLLVGGRK